ncbi:LOW QUALITY PROTEIN: endoplasmic reticulum metallopeptidase 1-like [Drosophila sulfurigaster albostrigata]|uniref:LOW QUALITY PROTEIN: endoplasmic reticulum metallopeptidase 1-like n=1 Tax=Drosophila sulfurigaster albostrigata TaxID=89887 RepID=UPI002D21E566|nr:LOW QUALITY PROTEIN: endoplasmic reticulum metallopeptidase 1-like [Drosophila sulfurigaster albostrigata]
MDDSENLIEEESKNSTVNNGNKILSRLFATLSVLFWVILFFAVVIPLFYRLPKAKMMEDSDKNVFIAERAYKDLYSLSNIGTKLVGSKENEIDAVEFLLKQLNQIKEDSLKEYYDIEIDSSQASGQYLRGNLIMLYKGVQNIVVKISPINSTSETFLLVNSHFDSKPFTSSAGDAGFMIVTMLEVLRVIATSKQPIVHPVVFLFNGAEESGLLASHGFITTHKWAPYCKAVINLDAAGSGGRDILFQSGPNHTWLVDYYKKYIKHPFATTMGEEIFQSGIMPSDTDFRQFKTYANIPGLDMAQCFNGYVYHTKYDTIDVIPVESLQNTGDNILSLVRGLANATELYDTSAYKTGHAVFFDFLGLYFFHYSEATGEYLNFGIAGAALVLVFISIWRMSDVSQVTICHLIRWFILVVIIQIIAFALGLALPIVVAYLMDSLGLSLTYYSTPLLVVGLYVCPSLIGLSLPTTIYYTLQRNKKLSSPYHLQLALHGQAVILALLTISLTVLGIRSSYILMIPLIFYVASLTLNLLTPMHDKGYSWVALLKISQIIPALYSSYIAYLFIVVLTPMGARAGSDSNRDLYIAAMSAMGTVLSFGFLVPLINIFRRPSLVVYALLATTVLSVFLASSTQLGFPYRPRTSGQRVAYLHVRNKFYEYDGSLSKDESGYLFLYQDRRKETVLEGTNVNLSGLVSVTSRCEKYMMCGMPLYDSRYVQQRLDTKWMPRSIPVTPPGSTKLELLSKTIINSTTCRFEYNLTGPPQMSLFFEAYEDVTIINWSFLESYLNNPPAHPLAYHILINQGIDSSPMNFFVETSKHNGDFGVPLFQLGVSGHYIGDDLDEESADMRTKFPAFAIQADWPASYERYKF